MLVREGQELTRGSPCTDLFFLFYFFGNRFNDVGPTFRIYQKAGERLIVWHGHGHGMSFVLWHENGMVMLIKA